MLNGSLHLLVQDRGRELADAALRERPRRPLPTPDRLQLRRAQAKRKLLRSAVGKG